MQTKKTSLYFQNFYLYKREGDLAQLARASALQAEGQGFKSPNLHTKRSLTEEGKETKKGSSFKRVESSESLTEECYE